MDNTLSLDYQQTDFGREFAEEVERLDGRIDDEIEARSDADDNLQNQIDTIKASSDVVDIVGTYAELEGYDTSKLNDNDIVKVLEDETHDGDITYYRWSTSTEVFSFVGSLSAYYSKGETDTLLSGKQDTLTAGTNIQINDNIISATDTTYSDFTGTDGTTAGSAGLVPAPATTDAGKYLKADGTWDTISIPTVTLYSDIGQNTDGAMTQKAVSDSLFVNSDRTRIKISDNTSSNNANGDIVIGHSGVAAYTANSIAIGMRGTAAGTSGSTSGSNTAIGTDSVRAIGGNSTALGNSGITASGNGSTAIGALGVTASAAHSVAIGYGNTFADHSDSVALGSNSITGRTNELSLGQSASGMNPEKTRYIAHVTAGVKDTDAVNKKQLDDAIAAVPAASNINSTDWSALWQ